MCFRDLGSRLKSILLLAELSQENTTCFKSDLKIIISLLLSLSHSVEQQSFEKKKFCFFFENVLTVSLDAQNVEREAFFSSPYVAAAAGLLHVCRWTR